MLHTAASATSQTAQDREARIQDLLRQLRPDAEQRLRQMAERLVDLPEQQSFGQIEYDLRDLAHQLAADVHQTGLQAGKKRATTAPAASVPTVKPTLVSSDTAPKPG
jgi:TolA-binding protein